MQEELGCNQPRKWKYLLKLKHKNMDAMRYFPSFVTHGSSTHRKIEQTLKCKKKKINAAFVNIPECKHTHRAFVSTFPLKLFQSSLLSHVPQKSHLQSSLTPY